MAEMTEEHQDLVVRAGRTPAAVVEPRVGVCAASCRLDEAIEDLEIVCVNVYVPDTSHPDDEVELIYCQMEAHLRQGRQGPVHGQFRLHHCERDRVGLRCRARDARHVLDASHDDPTNRCDAR